MRHDAIDGAPGSACAPGTGGSDFDPASGGAGRAGMLMPSRWLMALIVLGLIGLVTYPGDDPGPESSRMRLIPGSPGGQTIDFALSRDGKWVATTSSDGQGSLRSLGDDPSLGRILQPRGGLAHGLAFSPDGRTLALGRDPTGILIFDLARGPGTPLDVPLHGIRALAFSPDGRSLAASTERDGEILLWDLDAGRVRMRLRGHHSAVCLAFSPDDRSLAAGEKKEKRVTLWDLATGRSRSILKGLSGPITSVAFSPDGRLLAAASPYDRPVRLWDPRSGRLRLGVAGHAGGTGAVVFSPDGRRLATSGSDGTVQIWSPTTGEWLAALDGWSSWLAQLAFSADGRILTAAGSDNHVRIWDMDGIGEAGGDRPRR
jgi:WD40 repeat protein